jgi:hypothetical protein
MRKVRLDALVDPRGDEQDIYLVVGDLGRLDRRREARTPTAASPQLPDLHMSTK